MIDYLDGMYAFAIYDGEAEAHRAAHPNVYLRSTEECYYHKVFMEVFDNPAPVLANVGRWSERPDEVRCK